MEPRKMVQMNLFAGQKLRHRCREQMYGHQGGKAAGVMVVVWWIGGLGLTCIHWCAENGWLIRPAV